MLLQNETLTSEKENLLAGMESIRSSLKQLEAQNQELQKHSASLERDVVAERTLKEHKMKVYLKIYIFYYKLIFKCTARIVF